MKNEDDFKKGLLLAGLREARENIRPGQGVSTDDLHCILAALEYVLDSTPSPSRLLAAPKDEDETAPSGPSVYYLLRNPQV